MDPKLFQAFFPVVRREAPRIQGQHQMLWWVVELLSELKEQVLQTPTGTGETASTYLHNSPTKAV